MKKFICLIAAMVCSCSLYAAGKLPAKYGKVTPEELKMTVYAADSGAAAVVLSDYGYFDANNFRFTRTTRYKVLRKSGSGIASFVLQPHADIFVKGVTYNLENDNIVETKLESKAIYRERVYGNIERLRIAMPNVTVGSVFDIEMTYIGIPSSWPFQREIPVAYSELVMTSSPYVTIRDHFSGFEKLKLMEDGHWLAENMPAFKEEPYISSIENFVTKLEFDIHSVHFRTFYEAVTTNWEELCGHLGDNEYFGLALDESAYMNRAADEIRKKTKDPHEQIRLAHEYVKSFKWNGYESLFTTEKSIKWSLDKKSGNSADINLALVQLLDKLGLKVNPVLISTRDHGFLSPNNPSLNKLNYVIARVDLGDRNVLIDATEEVAPYDLLPERCLNYYGRLYSSRSSDLVELNTEKKDKEMVYYNLTMNEDLQLSGTMTIQRWDYAAFDFRKKYKRMSSQDEFLETMLGEFPGLKISNAAIVNIDSLYLPVKENYTIELNNQVEVLDQKLYLLPVILHGMKENPFKSDERKYPVEFVHGIERNVSATIQLPENFEVISSPSAIKANLQDKTAGFSYLVATNGHTIQFSFKMNILKPVYGELEYKEIREFFNQIVIKQHEPIVLRKM
jgi:hypothetical protein